MAVLSAILRSMPLQARQHANQIVRSGPTTFSEITDDNELHRLSASKKYFWILGVFCWRS